MSRHVADHRPTSDGGRTRHFLDVEMAKGAEGSHPAAKTLHERAATRSDSARLKEFLRIERGETT